MSKQCFLKIPNQNARVGNRWDYNSMCQKVPSIINSGADVAIPKGEKEHLFHISPDWLLIYRQDGNELLLYRTGTHADLFGM